jgi:hypothetical protein
VDPDYKSVSLTWQCSPNEDAEAIASHLNLLTEKYLNNLHAERLRHIPLPKPPKPKPPAGEVNEERMARLLGYVRSTSEEPDDEQEEAAKIIPIARAAR